MPFPVLYQELIDADFSEEEIELKLVSGFSIEEIYVEAVHNELIEVNVID